MPLVSLEQLLGYVDSKYRLVIIAAKRAKQLLRGAEPLLAAKSHKPTYIALEEIGAGALTYEAQPPEGALAQELIGTEPKPTWFRSLSAEETLGEGVMAEEEEEELQEAEAEEAPPELLVEEVEAAEEPEITDLEALEAPQAVEDES